MEALEPRRLLDASPLISEFMAVNRSGLQDADGDYSDWIELTNSGDAPVNLSGYWLTDDTAELTKWRLPDLTLNPSGYLTVFASGKDRVDPGSELHTSFRLSGSGENLALIAPDGQSVVHTYGPQFPPQSPDVAYGVGTGIAPTELLAVGATAAYLVPTDDALNEQWYLSEFDDSAWKSGPTGVGYDTGVRETPLFAEAVLALHPIAYWRFEETAGVTALNSGILGSEVDGTVEGEATLDLPGAGATQPNIGLGDDNSAAGFDGADDAVTTGQPILNDVTQFTLMGFIRPTNVSGSRLGLWGQNDTVEFGFHTADTLRLFAGGGGGDVRVDYTLPKDEWHHLAAVGTGENLQIYLDGQLLAEGGNPTASYGTSDFGFNIGGGGIFSRSGNFFGGEIDEVAVFDRALTAEQIADLLDNPDTPGAGGDFDPLIVTDVTGDLLGSGTSVYVRIPFTASDPTRFNQLTLDVQYDDGFVAYLNGAEIVRRNAPGEEETSLAFDAAATTARLDADAVQLESIDVSGSRDALLPGQNVLAIHGLNAASDNPDFLLVPQLRAAVLTVDVDTVGYLTTPTINEFNNPVSQQLGPIVVESAHSPPQPSAADPTVVTAIVERTLNDVSRVELIYRVMYADEITVPMVDDGTGVDAAANDGVFTAMIPAAAAQPGEMLRWYVRATDTVEASGRLPKFEVRSGDNQSPEYFGTMIVDPSATSEIPILNWFVEDDRGAGTRSGARASLYYEGEFHDNVFVRQRGGSTASNRKTNFKFDFRGSQFRFDPAFGRVEEFNLNSTASDKAYVRQSMAFEAYRVVGSPSSISFPMHVRRNNEFYGVFAFIEEPSEQMLEREGLDPNGALYKIYNEFTSASGAEKKTRRDEDNADLADFVAKINRELEGEELANYLYDNVDIPAVLNYFVGTILAHQNDNPHKNHYLYRDTEGSGEWLYLPWDHDLTWGSNWVGTSYSDVIYADVDVITFGPVPTHNPAVIHPSHPLINTEGYREWNNHWNRLMDALLNVPTIREMYLRRLRTSMDEFLGEPGTTDSYFDQRFDEYAQIMAPDARLDYEQWANPWAFGEDQSFQQAIDVIKDEYLAVRREHLYVNHSIDRIDSQEFSVLIPEFTSAKYFVPADDALATTWTAADFDDSGWSSGETGIGYEERPRTLTELIKTQVIPTETVEDGTSIFLRVPFDVGDPAALEKLSLRMMYDDGFIAYINGVEVARGNINDMSLYNSETRPRNAALATSFEDTDISEHVGLLQPGQNVLAIHGLNRRATDSDMLILPSLVEGDFSSVEVAGIPHAQAGNPSINFDDASFDANPASGNQDQEYLKLDNPNDVAVDISGWRFEGGITHTFRPGTVIPAGSSMYISPNVRSFRARESGPSGGQGLFVQGNYGGHLSNRGETVRLLAADDTLMDSLTIDADPSDAQRFLRVTEVNYNPRGLDDTTEFIELTNISSGADATTLALDGVMLSRGPSEPFVFPAGTALAEGEYLVVVNDLSAFQAAYPSVDPQKVFGPYAGNLSNQGERIKLDDSLGSSIVDFTYGDGDPWPERADGGGSSILLSDPAGTAEAELSKYYRWQASTDFGGSPTTDSSPSSGVVINEVLTNTDAPDADAIELLNAGDQAVDISGWFLSDSSDDLLKFRIPDGSSLGPGEHAVFTETQFNPNPRNPGPKSFALNGSEGDDVWLVAPDGQGGIASILDHVRFGAAASGETLGRVPDGTGRLAPMTSVTLGSANSAPRVGPVIISEINYHPSGPSAAALAANPGQTADDLEFIEVFNPTAETVDMRYWQIRGGVDFDFPAGAVVPAGQSVVIVSFNPDSARNEIRRDALRVHYGIDDSVTMLGGYQGQLDDGGEPIRLLRPDRQPADGSAPVSLLIEDEVLFDDRSPWPADADGDGQTLTRSAVDGWGNAAGSWRAAPPSPGLAQFVATVPGDSNDDGVFTQVDLELVRQVGKYMSGQPATFSDGDWNGDGVFNQLDIVAALQSGSFEQIALAAVRPHARAANAHRPNPHAESTVTAADGAHGVLDGLFAEIDIRGI